MTEWLAKSWKCILIMKMLLSDKEKGKRKGESLDVNIAIEITIIDNDLK